MNIIVLGASSAIAEATLRLFAARGDCLYLFARNEERLNIIASDLRVRGAKNVYVSVLNVDDMKACVLDLNKSFEQLGCVDLVLVAYGTLPDQKACEHSRELTYQVIATNALSTILLLTEIANRLERQQQGLLAVITSVAGDRGRQSNYVYGAAKGMVSIFLQGLQQRLHPAGVGVIDIKPGFVDTPMTKHIPKNVLWVKPEVIADGIVKSLSKKSGVVYFPWFWRYIMILIKIIPTKIFKMMRL